MIIKQIQDYYGNIPKAADAVGVTRQTFHRWKKQNKIPVKYLKLYKKFIDFDILLKKEKK